MKLSSNMQSTRGGTPKVPHNRIVHDHIEVQAWKQPKKIFRRTSFMVMMFSGYCLAHTMTDQGRLKNRDYSRPDFKPKAAMVKDDSMLYDPAVKA